jgi:voltage-gated potassium channel
MINYKQRPRLRKVHASIRNTWLLFRQFQWPLIAFMLAIIGGGWIYFYLSDQAGQPIATRSEAMYHVLGLTFLNPIEEFPAFWYLQIFYFIMPVIGIGILAQGFAEFGVLLFNRKARGKEWEMAVASTFNHHVVLIGLGHLGFRVANHLFSMGQDVVVIELNPKADLVNSVRDLGIPVIEDDGTRESALKGAGIQQARAIILCTQDDSLNLKMALKARGLNPSINVVLRIFDDDFAAALEKQFGFIAISATGTASPVFAAAAAGVDMTRPITVEGQALSLARLGVANYPHLAGLLVGQIEKDFDVSVVLLRRGSEEADFHPSSERKIESRDTLAVLGSAMQINLLAQNDRR